MTLFVLGVSHKHTPLDVRERLFLPRDYHGDALHALSAYAVELFILATCNRTEIYCFTQDIEPIIKWWQGFTGVPDVLMRQYLYVHADIVAEQHLIRVASGLDSMIVGETQILGQFKQACELAKSHHVFDKLLQQLTQRVLTVAKKVRTETDLGKYSLSVAAVACQLVNKIYTINLSEQKILLLGSGDTSTLAARYLADYAVQTLYIVSQNVERAQKLLADLSIPNKHAVTYTALTSLLPQIDVIIASTHSTVPIITPELLVQRKTNVLLLDLGMPRNVAPEVATLAGVTLHTIDDLNLQIIDHECRRQLAALQAEEMINDCVNNYATLANSLESMAELCKMRQQAAEVRDEVMQRAQRWLAQGRPSHEVVAQSINLLMQKLLHHPTVKMRELMAQGKWQEAKLLHSLFDYEEN